MEHGNQHLMEWRIPAYLSAGKKKPANKMVMIDEDLI
jgi:hypothetical protein